MAGSYLVEGRSVRSVVLDYVEAVVFVLVPCYCVWLVFYFVCGLLWLVFMRCCAAAEVLRLSNVEFTYGSLYDYS